MRNSGFVWLLFFMNLMWTPMVFGASVDLVLDPNSIAFSDTSPTEGDAISISAVVRNAGDADVGDDIEVRFIEGEPGKGGLQIGSNAIVLGLKAGASRATDVKWRAAPGKTKIYAIADPDNLVKEANEDNNMVVKTITGKKWKGAKVTEEQIKESVKKGLEWLRSQQGEFYVTCSNGHDNFLYAALAYGRCVICGENLKGIEPTRAPEQTMPGGWMAEIGPGMTSLAIMTLLHAGISESDPAISMGIDHLLHKILFSMGLELQEDLEDGNFSEQLRQQFAENNILLPQNVTIRVKEGQDMWVLHDEGGSMLYVIKKEGDVLNTYLNNAPVKPEEWSDPYDHAVGILAFTSTENKEKYWDLVEYSTKRLEALQTEDGGWGYGAVADAAHLQYVILGLYAAKQWGVEIKPETWSRAAVWLTNMQRPDGGWNYYSSGSGPFAEDSYGSMTATAIMGLKAAGISPSSESIKRGIKWLEKYYSVTRNPGSFYWHYYYLVALQRAMDMPPGQDKLGSHDWYSDIASFLISKQQADGSWIAATPIYTVGAVGQAPTIAEWGQDRGDLMATSFALLFLIRAMPKPAAPDVSLGPQHITFSKADPEEDEQVNVSASVTNTGLVPVENVQVSFYDGDPESGGVLIGVAETIPSLSAGEAKKASVIWKVRGKGQHRIYAIIDPSNSISEFNEDNNVAYGEIRIGGESMPAIPAMVQVGDGLYKLGGVDLDLNKKTITMYGRVNMSYGLVELLACTRIGKLHESALVMDVQPIHLQTALILLGLEFEGGLRYQGDPRTPKGDRVRIWVEWDTDGQVKRHRAEDLVFNRQTQNSMQHTDWVFSGSRINDNGVFMAQAVGTLITTFHDPDAIIDNPLPGGADDTVYIVNTQVIPPKGTDLRMIITPAKSS